MLATEHRDGGYREGWMDGWMMEGWMDESTDDE